MDSADITALTAAFDPSVLLTTFIGLAGFILVALGITVGVSIAKGSVRKVTGKLSRGV